MARPLLTIDEYVTGIETGDRAILGRAITLIESRHRTDREQATELLQRLLSLAGNAWRIGITGVPGAGKSTFIDQFGTNLTAAGHRVAVLAVDPTSTISGGSILGDKTRMGRLSVDPDAFIRPSPNAGTLGGVAAQTRETMRLCEAAGFDVIIVETVGVGQSETVVDDMVDIFVVLTLAGAGDELQGIKRGVIELADVIAVNKADGDNGQRAKEAATDFRMALRYLTPKSPGWDPPVITCSSKENRGVDEIWQLVRAHRVAMEEASEFDTRRRRQLVRWMWARIEDDLMGALREHPDVTQMLPQLEADVREHRITPALAAEKLLNTFRRP